MCLVLPFAHRRRWEKSPCLFLLAHICMKTQGRPVRCKKAISRDAGGGAGEMTGQDRRNWVIIFLHFSVVGYISIKAEGNLTDAAPTRPLSVRVQDFIAMQQFWGHPSFCKQSLIHVPEVTPVNSLVHTKVK